jgi:hypothetical protein
MRPGLVLLLSGIAVLFLASSLLADDGSPMIDGSALPDTSAVTPGSLVGIRPGFSLGEKPRLAHSPMKSVLFSTAMPGMGQAVNGRWAKASAFIALGSILISRIAVESQRSDRFLHLSRSATTDSDAEAYYEQYSSHFDRRDRLVWWAVSFWLYNMLDAYIDGQLFGFSRQ